MGILDKSALDDFVGGQGMNQAGHGQEKHNCRNKLKIKSGFNTLDHYHKIPARGLCLRLTGAILMPGMAAEVKKTVSVFFHCLARQEGFIHINIIFNVLELDIGLMFLFDIFHEHCRCSPDTLNFF